MKKLKTIFMGTPDFSLPVLEMLSTHPKIDLIHIITMPDRPAGRGQELHAPPVAQFAKEKKIKLLQTENINKEDDFLYQCEKESIDLIIVLAFAQFLGNRVLALPKLGCFNIHTSLLPKYRGAAPIQYALLNGDKETGVSIQKMVKKMDAGDIAHSHPLTIMEEESGGLLYTRLKFQAALAAYDFLQKLISNKISYVVQDESQISFAPTLKKEDGLMNFREKTFSELWNQWRAMDPWPGTYCFLGSKRLKVLEFEKNSKKVNPGEVNIDFGQLLVGCSDGTVHLTKIQLEGKTPCSDADLLKGYREKILINP
ncbi:MAG: methionyl-tRNA formyltransferase [Bacteriovoracaceae bacterium]